MMSLNLNNFVRFGRLSMCISSQKFYITKVFVVL